MRSTVVAIALLALSSCAPAGDEPGRASSTSSSPATSTAQQPATNAPSAVARSGVPPARPSSAVVAARKPAVVELRVTEISASHAENGRGAIVATKRPVALDVVAPSWRGRALDPVLSVGRLRFHKYSHPAKGVLRFIMSDVDQLVAGAEVSLQYGGDVSSRVVVSKGLKLP